MVVPNVQSPIVAGSRVRHHAPLKHNGQRWQALAVQDYESRALPLSYGAGPLTKRRCCSRYNGIDTVLSSSPFASDTSAVARPSFNDGVTLTARKPALARSAFCTAARSETFALAIAALWLCASV